MAEKRHLVLIADDYEPDRFFLKEAMRRYAPQLQIVAELESGDDVIAYLSGKNQYADRNLHPLPEALILDMQMPGMNGLEVLEWLDQHSFPQLKIAVLADSSSLHFRQRAVDLGVNHFYSKYSRGDELIQLVTRLQEGLAKGEKGRFL